LYIASSEELGPGNGNRLIQFNETTKIWLSAETVRKMETECGAGRGFMDITDFQDLGKIPVPVLNDIPTSIKHATIVRPLLPLLSSIAISDAIKALSAYTTRYYRDQTGRQSAEWIANQYRAYSSHRTDITVELFPHAGWVQPSVVVRIQGSGPQKDEIVVIGAHIDSVSNGATAPGADDDASGTATVLEIFRVLAVNNFVPKRTIEFHGYAAEEAGLLGSQAIASQYASDNKKVVSMMQFDMTGYVRPGTTPTIGIVTDFTNPALTDFTKLLVDTYIQGVGRSDTRCGYACSDHASWTRAGYFSAFAFEGLFGNSNPNIHTTRDLIEHLNLGHALAFAQLGLSYVVELSLD